MKAPADSVARGTETARPAWIIFPKYQPEAKARLEPVPRARTFMRVADNAFNYSVLGATGFTTLANLIDASHSYDFTYSALDEATETFAALRPPMGTNRQTGERRLTENCHPDESRDPAALNVT
jgi:hypothetical protein